MRRLRRLERESGLRAVRRPAGAPRAWPAAALAAALLAPGSSAALVLWDAGFDAQPLGRLFYVSNPDGPPDLPTFLRTGTGAVAYQVVAASGDLVAKPLEVVETAGIPRATFSLAQADGFAPLASGRVRVELDLLVGGCALTAIGQTTSERCYQVVVLGSETGTDTTGLPPSPGTAPAACATATTA